MVVNRSPPSPLINDNKKGKIDFHTMNCLVCELSVILTQKISCHDCSKNFHKACVFINTSQQSYFERNNIPWVCSSCYYSKSAACSKSISNLNSSIIELNKSLESCSRNAKGVSEQVSYIHQELTQRIVAVESKATETSKRVTDLEFNSLSNCIIVHGLSKQSFKTDDLLRNYILKFLKVLNVTLETSLFDFKWNVIDSSLNIYILNTQTIHDIFLNYRDIAGSNGVFSEDHGSISNIPASSIKLEFIYESLSSRKMTDALEMELRSRDIKINGIQYLVDENIIKLKKYVTVISAHLNIPVQLSDFNISRIKGTSSCIATFNNSDVRDNLFYAYMNVVSRAKSAGISNEALQNVPCTSNITFNDNLAHTSRIIYNFCRHLKNCSIIKSFSTRRGKVVIKKGSTDDKWKIVTSLDGLYHELNN